MGNLSAKASAFFDDLKHSWYFRIYIFFWLFFAIVTFACLIILGQRATTIQKQPTWRLWVENPNSIAFPNFQIRTNIDESQNSILGPVCTCAAGSSFTSPAISACGTALPLSKCFSVAGSQFTGVLNNTGSLTAYNNLDCTFNVTGPVTGDRVILVAFTENTDLGNTITYIQPTQNAVLGIVKTVIKGNGVNSNVWGRNLMYQSSVADGQLFAVRMQYDTFSVFHWVEDSGFDSWLSVGGIGGFAFFMIILHTILMTLVEICLPNESKFLKGVGVSSASDYNAVR